MDEGNRPSNILCRKTARKKPWFLAGGLTAENVGRAISLIHPDVVDVSSGVEYTDRKGKDPEKIAAFIQAVKES